LNHEPGVFGEGNLVLNTPKQLRDMRKVYESEKPGEGEKVFEKDTPGMAQWRALYRTDPKTFLTMYQKAEADFRKAKAEKMKELGEKPKADRDPASVKVADIIDRLLAEWEEANAGEV
jgi:hypothetical protein